jgi:hypothetical protein
MKGYTRKLFYSSQRGAKRGQYEQLKKNYWVNKIRQARSGKWYFEVCK